MNWIKIIATEAALVVLGVVALSGLAFAGASSGSPEAQKLNDLLARTSIQTSIFLDQFSEVKCTEQVRQEKLGKDNKVELKEDSTFDYLVILTSAEGELNLSESRIPLREARRDRKNTSMLLSNGFATLFLVFHPYYADAFRFTLAGEEVTVETHDERLTTVIAEQGMREARVPRRARRRTVDSAAAAVMLQSYLETTS